jgi:hypothetical protein
MTMAQPFDVDAETNLAISLLDAQQGPHMQRAIKQICFSARPGNNNKSAVGLLHILRYTIIHGADTNNALRVAWDSRLPGP